MFTAAIYKSQDIETTYLSMGEWIKNDETHTHTKKNGIYYSAIKKEWNHAICNNMDGPSGYAKWSK